MMVSKKPSAFTVLKEKKLAGTLTSAELKKYKKLKKEKREKRLNKTNGSVLNLSLDDTIAEPPVTESPKKRKKENAPIPSSQEFLPEVPAVASSELPSAQSEPDIDLSEAEETEETPAAPQNEALKEFLQSQYKTVQSMLDDLKKTANLHGIELEVADVKPVVGRKGKLVKKMTNFMVWRDRPDQAGLTVEKLKEKWAAVTDDEKKVLSSEARQMNKGSGWDAKKAPRIKKINAYTAFCSLQIKENKKKMTECGELWKTLTDGEKEQYQKIAATRNKTMFKLHNPDKNVILNKED